jgi:hypothetical protein
MGKYAGCIRYRGGRWFHTLNWNDVVMMYIKFPSIIFMEDGFLDDLTILHQLHM